MSVEFSGLFGLLWLILVVYALVKILASPASTGSKVLWIVVILLLPVLGFLAWLVFGPRG